MCIIKKSSLNSLNKQISHTATTIANLINCKDSDKLEVIYEIFNGVMKIIYLSKLNDKSSSVYYHKSAKTGYYITNSGKLLPTRYLSINHLAPIRKEYKFTDRFGIRRHPFHKASKKKFSFHSGIDFSCKQGTEVYSMEDGVVVKACFRYDYGNHVIIQHNKEFFTLYAHLSKTYVKENQTISKYQLIGEVGATGAATGPHLHLEIRKNHLRLNPEKVYFLSSNSISEDQKQKFFFTKKYINNIREILLGHLTIGNITKQADQKKPKKKSR
jgi:murein DD-endopeptidase MepM/ murein hydrolase activator NlpD